MERMKNLETLVTIGMRGDGDEPMSEDADIALLEKIVKDQRQIIKTFIRKPAKQFTWNMTCKPFRPATWKCIFY